MGHRSEQVGVMEAVYRDTIDVRAGRRSFIAPIPSRRSGTDHHQGGNEQYLEGQTPGYSGVCLHLTRQHAGEKHNEHMLLKSKHN